jgi:dTDP-4-dehydrorhamnose 3,5-epimerase
MIQDVFYWKTVKIQDNRGLFTKIFTTEILPKIKNFSVQDYFLTNSKTAVIRGMHLQVNEHANNRVIFVNHGKVEDVLIDVRNWKNEVTLPHKNSIYLGPEEEFDCVFVPAGVAHGFATIKDAEVVYLSDRNYSVAHDRGFNPLSFSHAWEVDKPVLSKRDKNLPSLKDFTF